MVKTKAESTRYSKMQNIRRGCNRTGEATALHLFTLAAALNDTHDLASSATPCSESQISKNDDLLFKLLVSPCRQKEKSSVEVVDKKYCIQPIESKLDRFSHKNVMEQSQLCDNIYLESTINLIEKIATKVVTLTPRLANLVTKRQQDYTNVSATYEELCRIFDISKRQQKRNFKRKKKVFSQRLVIESANESENEMVWNLVKKPSCNSHRNHFHQLSE